MRVVQLTAENLLRLKAIELAPDAADAVVIVSGKNAQGKTSVLNAIALALGGAQASKLIDRPIRDGSDSAEVTVDLGEFTVTRRWTANDKSTLAVVSKDGAKYSSPQKFLDERLGALSFDPLAFTLKSDREQLETLLGLVELPFDPAHFAAQRKAVYDERTDANRELKRLEGRLSGIKRPAGELPAEVKLDDLLEERRAAELEGRRMRGVREDLAGAYGKADRLRAELATVEADIAEGEEVSRSLPSEPPDLAAIDERMRRIEETNLAARVQRSAAATYAELDAAKDAVAALTAKIEKGDAWKAGKLAEAMMPIDGLGFDESGVTYQGVPYRQASAAEQLRVSMAMSMASNPEIRVILIRDGSLLDKDNMALIEEMAAGRDFQVFVERVSDDAQVGFVIEDGELA